MSGKQKPKKTISGTRFLHLTNLKQHRKDGDKVTPATEEEVVMLTDEITRLRTLVRRLAFTARDIYLADVNDTAIFPMDDDVVRKEFSR